MKINVNKIKETWEMDWDVDNVYYKVEEDKIIKINIETGEVFSYKFATVH
ncbi:hypothetical protein [Cytobacillus gottheilii]|nr:hypothetical protein [Cytobacillus gottheilii]